MEKVWNYSAGPAQIPGNVLEHAQKELDSYKGSGMSVMELSHRSAEFQEIIDQAEQGVRDLLNIPENYKVLFLQGGASLQFIMAAMNLKVAGKAAYVDTGNWSNKAVIEAQNSGMEVDIIASSKNKNYQEIPEINTDFTGYDYVHITSNNTIEGTEFFDYPDTGDVPLVADMSSDILSRPIDVGKFGLIYAGAQKNIGIAGMTLVIIRDDLLNKNPELPKLLNYQTHAEKGSMYNTPPTFAIYIAGLVFDWLKEQGGLEGMEKINREKASLIYNKVDESTLFDATVNNENRSIMNIPFTTGDTGLDQEFIKKADEKGLKNLKGHRSVGGMRASIYNAMPLEGVQALLEFMDDFEKAKGDQ